MIQKEDALEVILFALDRFIGQNALTHNTMTRVKTIHDRNHLLVEDNPSIEFDLLELDDDFNEVTKPVTYKITVERIK